MIEHEKALAALRGRLPGLSFSVVETGRDVRVFVREGKRTVCIVDIDKALANVDLAREVERVMAVAKAAA